MNELLELAEDVGVSERTLRRAVNQGTLRAVRHSPRKLRLPLGEQRYVRRSWGLLSSLRASLRTEQNVRLALLFGSAARGADTAGSDVDVLVDLRDPSLERMVDLAEKLGDAVGRPVDLVRLEDAESEPLFLAEVAEEARVLVDRRGAWPTLRREAAELRQRGGVEEREKIDAALTGIDEFLAR